MKRNSIFRYSGSIIFTLLFVLMVASFSSQSLLAEENIEENKIEGGKVYAPTSLQSETVYHLAPITLKPHYGAGKNEVKKLELLVSGMPDPFVFEKVKVSQNQADPKILLWDAAKSINKGIRIDKLHVEILNNEISQLSAKKITIHNPNNKKQSITLLEPNIDFLPSSHMLPEKFLLSVKGIQFKGSRESLKTGFIQVGLNTESNNQGLLIKSFFKSEAISFKSKREDIKFGALNMTSEGFAQSVNKEDFESFKKNFSLTLQQLLKKEDAFFDNLFRLVNDYTDLVIKMNIGDSKGELHWEGLESLEESRYSGKQHLVVGPVTLNGSEKVQAQNISGTLTAILPKISYNEKNFSLLMEGLQLNGQASYNIGMADYVRGLMGYVKTYVISMGSYYIGGPVARRSSHSYNPLVYMASYLSLYPENANYEFKINHLSYQTRHAKGDYQNMVLGFIAKDQQVAYLGSGKFDIDYEEIKLKPHKKKKSEDKLEIPEEYFRRPKKDIVGGNFDFFFGMNVPWKKMISQSREIIQSPEQYHNIAEIFINESIGGELRGTLDYGKNHFSVNLDSLVEIPLGTVFQKKPYPKFVSGKDPLENWEKISSWSEDFFQTIAERFVLNGQHRVSLKIHQLKNLEDYLSDTDRGMHRSLSSLVGSPLVKLDEAQDSLSMIIDYNNGKVLVNGQENSIAQTEVDKWKKEIKESQKRAKKRARRRR